MSFPRWQSVANVVVAQLNTAIVTAGSFIVTPAILFGLGDSAYGGWLLINSFISYMRLLDLGTSSGTIKYGAGAHARGDAVDLARVMNTSSAIFVVLGTMAMLGAVALTAVLPRLYPTIATGQSATILALGAAIALDLVFRPFSATIRMRSLFFVTDTVEICTYSIFKFGLVLYFAYERTLSYRVLAFLTLGETIARICFVITVALVRFPGSRKMNPLRAERAMVRKISGMGLAMSIITVAEIVRFQIDAAVIGYFMPNSPVNISIFGVGTRLASIAYTTIIVIGGVVMPRFSGLSEKGDRAGMLDLLRRTSLIVDLVASCVLVNLAVLGPQFLHLWLHKPWIDTSGKILLLMLPAYFVGLTSGPSYEVLIGRGQLRGITMLAVAEALVNLTLSVILVHPLGIFGVALGTAIPLVGFRGILFPLLLRREIQLPLSDYFKMHARPLGVCLVYLVLVGGLSQVPLTSYARFFALGTGSVIVFLIVAGLLVPEARAIVKQRLRRGRPSVTSA